MEKNEATRRVSSFPKPLSQCVEKLTRPVLKAKGLAGSRLIEEWETIIGPLLARHAVAEKLSFPRGKKTGGTLFIAVENGFATELQHMQPVILERLAVYFGYQAITRIVITHTFQAEEEPARTPRPRIGKASPAFAMENVADSDLRDALQSLANTLSQPRA